MRNSVENEAGVFYAKKGYYKGKEVTVTHHHGAEVYLEDYPVNGADGLVVGCWVPSDSVVYTSVPNTVDKKGKIKDENYKRRSKQVNQKFGRRQKEMAV